MKMSQNFFATDAAEVILKFNNQTDLVLKKKILIRHKHV